MTGGGAMRVPREEAPLRVSLASRAQTMRAVREAFANRQAGQTTGPPLEIFDLSFGRRDGSRPC
jgi:hypothetical protein